MDAPPPIVIEPAGPARHSVIWLHGLGADGHDFEPVVPALRLPDGLGVRFVFPHAPVRPVTVNGGMAMPAWFDIFGLDDGAPLDLPGIEAAAAHLAALVAAEGERGVPSERVVVAGFSQGGLVALAAALRMTEPLAGVMALSTWLPEAVVVAGAPRRMVFQAHGRQDPVIPLAVGLAARNRLLAAGHQVEWHEYDMAHALCAGEVDDIRVWLLARFGG